MAETSILTELVIDLQKRYEGRYDEAVLVRDTAYIEVVQSCMKIMYFYPQLIHKISDEEASAFLLFVMPNIKTLIMDFKYKGLSFEAYFKSVIRFRMVYFNHAQYSQNLRHSIAEQAWALEDPSRFLECSSDPLEPIIKDTDADDQYVQKRLYENAMFRLKNAMYRSKTCRKRVSIVLFCLIGEASILDLEVLSNLLGYSLEEVKRLKDVFCLYETRNSHRDSHQSQMRNIYLLKSISAELELKTSLASENSAIVDRIGLYKRRMAAASKKNSKPIRLSLKLLSDVLIKPRGSISSSVTIGKQMFLDALSFARGQDLVGDKTYYPFLRLEGFTAESKLLVDQARFSILEDIGCTCLQLSTLIKENAKRYGLIELRGNEYS